MRRGVANDVEAGGILVGDDRELRIGVDAVVDVDQLVTNAAGNRSLGQPRADRGGDVGHRDGPGELALRAVGQLNRDHGTSRRKKTRL